MELDNEGKAIMGMPSNTNFDRMVFRNTNEQKGRNISVTPANSTNKHLAYARIILDASTQSVKFSNGENETGLICLSGSATVKTGGATFSLAQYDSIYIPRDSEINIPFISLLIKMCSLTPNFISVSAHRVASVT